MKIYHFNFKPKDIKKWGSTYQFNQFPLFIESLKAEGITDYIQGYCHSSISQSQS